MAEATNTEYEEFEDEFTATRAGSQIELTIIEGGQASDDPVSNTWTFGRDEAIDLAVELMVAAKEN